MLDALRAFFAGYWAWEAARYHLGGLALVFLVAALVFRRVAIAVAVLVFGVYASLAVFFMRTYANYGLSFEVALGILLGMTVALAAVVYWAIFVRT